MTLHQVKPFDIQERYFISSVFLQMNYYFWLCIATGLVHWSYFKNNDLLHTLKVYKIPRKEHQAVDFWVTDEIATSEILFWKYLEYFPLI